MNIIRSPELRKEIHERYEFMMETVHELGQIALDMIDFKQVERLPYKPDGTIVTNVDMTINDEFIDRVEAAYPGDLVWGEEKSNRYKNDVQEANKNWVWLIDPIDGTKGLWRSYLSKRFDENTSSVMVTGFAPGRRTPTMSVIHNPFQKQPVTISADPYRTYYQSGDMPKPEMVHLHRGYGPQNLDSVNRYEKSNWSDCVPDLSYVNELVPRARKVDHQVFMGSVALGDVDLSVFPGPSNPHDVAPGALILHNAGGTVKTFKGESYEQVDWRIYPIAGTIGTANLELADEVVSAYESLDVVE